MCWPASESRDGVTPFQLRLNKIGILRFLPASIFGKGPLQIPFDQASFLRDGKHLTSVFQSQAANVLVDRPILALAGRRTIGRRAASAATL
jgi:hypothetical protein